LSAQSPSAVRLQPQPGTVTIILQLLRRWLGYLEWVPAALDHPGRRL
jgi:hypothetical protein